MKLWVLIWEYSVRAIYWLPIWQGLGVFQKSFSILVLCMKEAFALEGLTLIQLVANLANTKWCKNLKNDWNSGTWVLIWEYSVRAIYWLPIWQGLGGFQKSFSILVLWMKEAFALEGSTLIYCWWLICLNQNYAKKAEQWLKPWLMGTHLRVLCESYLMYTNMTGFRWRGTLLAF